MALQIVDRPIVKALTNSSTLGVYQLNYRLGIAMMLIVGMFDYAWRPFFLTNARDPEAKSLFSKVFTYFILIMLLMFLGVSFFVEDLVRIEFFGKHFFHPDYWVGVSIVPWILLAYVFNGAYVVFLAGAYLEKKTKFLPFITGLGALVNIGVNILLIPLMGIMGAALATLASYAIMAIAMYFASQKFYQIQYEWSKVAGTAFAAAIAFVAFKLLHPLPLEWYGLTVKLGLLLVFLALLPAFKVFSRSDIVLLRTTVQRYLVSSR
jgi:O-antigen/teichoic acid export membrane protein